MPASPYVSRINQIDAVQLDEEIYKVLRTQCKEICKYQPFGNVDRWQPEIDALLGYLVWNFSLRNGNSTFGQQLLNLHYANVTRAKSILYLMLTVVPAYVRDKLANSGANGKLAVALHRVGNVVKLLEFVNLLIFLDRGTQPRVIEYLLGIASQSTTAHKPRSIGYSYMTRELLWHGLMELFTVGLPMVNLHQLKHALKRLMFRKSERDVRRSFPTVDSSTKCAYCADTPIMPAHAGCAHVFCYYCLKAHFTAMDVFHCAECNAPLCAGNMKPYEIGSAPAARE